ncbi:MAG: ABC transporter permease [Candidatus Aenigmarchaeota archaeon]|nr:ABC transporter permease [Candidatus Aenigmarchaeota archaeon]
MKGLNYQAIYVIWLRQLKRFSRDKGRLISNFIQPFFFLSVLGFGLGSASFEGIPSGIEYIDVLTPGIIMMSIIFPSVFIGLSILWDRQFGFLQEVLVAPVSRMSIVIGTTLGGSTIALIQGFIVLFIASLLGVSISLSPMLLLGILVMVLTSFVAIGIGLVLASKMQSIEGFQFIVSLLVMPMIFLASPFAPLDSLPEILRTVALFDPITYGIDGLRGAMIGFSYFPLYVNIGVLLTLSIAMMFIGSYLFSKSEA